MFVYFYTVNNCIRPFQIYRVWASFGLGPFSLVYPDVQHTWRGSFGTTVKRNCSSKVAATYHAKLAGRPCGYLSARIHGQFQAV